MASGNLIQDYRHRCAQASVNRRGDAKTKASKNTMMSVSTWTSAPRKGPPIVGLCVPCNSSVGVALQ